MAATARSMQKSQFSEWAFVAAMLALYLTIACAQIKKPGLQYDEVLFAYIALGTGEPSQFIAYTARLKGHAIPTMAMTYIGALKGYLYMPIFKLFGVSPLTVRLPVILLAAGSLVFIYLFFKAAFGRRVAGLSLALTAVDPSFIVHTKLDWGPVAVTIFLKMASLYGLARWLQTRQNPWLALGAFLGGLALFDKGTYLWFLAGLAPAVWIVFRKEALRPLTLRTVSIFMIFFCVGASPFIHFNIKSRGASFHRQRLESRRTLGNVVTKIECLGDTLNGTDTYWRTVGQPLAFGLLSRTNSLLRGNLLPLLLLIATPIALASPRQRWAKVLLLASVGIFLQSLIFKNAGGSHHFMIAYPFPQAVVAWTFVYGFARLRERFRPDKARIGVALLAIVCLTPLVLDFAMDILYVKAFAQTGGRKYWTDAVYDLAAFAQKHPEKRFVLLEWGLHNQLFLLSKGTIRRKEAFWDLAGSEREAQTALSKLFTDPSNLYVIYSPRYNTPEIAERFHAEVKRQGLQEKIYKIFYERDGQPAYFLYQALRLPPPECDNGERFHYVIEGEQFADKAGGEIEDKASASPGKVLGKFWGVNASDFVTYKFSTPRRLPSVWLGLHYAFTDENPHYYYVYLDGRLANVVRLKPIPGSSEPVEGWQTSNVYLDGAEPGEHTLTIKPVDPYNPMSLDRLFICEGDAPPLYESGHAARRL